MNTMIRRTAALCWIAVLAVPFAQAEDAYLAEAKARLATLSDKFAGLAEATPADKLSYRPMEGVRSTSELFLHVAGGNYFVARAFGMQPPEGLNLRGLETSTADRDEIVSRLKMSFEHLAGAVAKVEPGSADSDMRMFGQDTTTRGALSMATNHLSEHLGQSIAYARASGVVPPWSQ